MLADDASNTACAARGPASTPSADPGAAVALSNGGRAAFSSWSQWGRGYRTYLTGLLIIGLLACHWAQWIVLPVEAYGALFALGLVFLRGAVGQTGGGA